LLKISFDLIGIVGLAQCKPFRNPLHVGVDDDGRFVEGLT
jgi:hypothetical protein